MYVPNENCFENHFYWTIFTCAAAVKRYFTSKKEADNRKSKNMDILHKQKQATYERKKKVGIKIDRLFIILPTAQEYFP
jgi:hypothetical protein